MTIPTQKNELIKRDYYYHCSEAQGFKQSTIRKYGQCIYKWQTCFPGEDFSLIDRLKCSEFKNFLKSEAEKKNTSLSNQYDILRHLKKFFLWLSEQKGYECIKKTDLDYLRLSNEEISKALEKTDREYPSLDEIKLIVTGIRGNSEIAMRDRALVAFLILTGMRISAVISLPMQSFDPSRLSIIQSPKKGVKTKFSKKIISTFLPIDWDEGESMFLNWYEYLLTKKEFGPTKPIFPATKNFSQLKVVDEFWKSASPVRKMIYENCKRAKLPNFNPHSFRHSAVAYISERGLVEADKRAISLVLGHSDIGTTFKSYGYGSLTPWQAVDRVREMRGRKCNDLALPQSDEELGKLLRSALNKS